MMYENSKKNVISNWQKKVTFKGKCQDFLWIGSTLPC